jgi:hypothetical protein
MSRDKSAMLIERINLLESKVDKLEKQIQNLVNAGIQQPAEKNAEVVLEYDKSRFRKILAALSIAERHNRTAVVSVATRTFMANSIDEKEQDLNSKSHYDFCCSLMESLWDNPEKHKVLEWAPNEKTKLEDVLAKVPVISTYSLKKIDLEHHLPFFQKRLSISSSEFPLQFVTFCYAVAAKSDGSRQTLEQFKKLFLDLNSLTAPLLQDKAFLDKLKRVL